MTFSVVRDLKMIWLHLQAGVTHEMLYHFADSMNITLPGGACPTVGAAGGYLQVRHFHL